MFKNLKKIFGFSYHHFQRKIQRIHPELQIGLSDDLPLESMRQIVEYAPFVGKVNLLETALQEKPDSFFPQRTLELVEIIAQKMAQIHDDDAQEREKVLDEILPEAFAMVREAARRVTGMRHFDSQILGGIILHKCNIAEMATGEGKTLVATLPAYLNALVKKGVHVVTVNDYLARRDREWMGPIYEFLGLSVGVIQSFMPFRERRAAYAADITYGTNNEFGFDYLRDNMAIALDQLVQRGYFYAIVDEVDSILVDEARTPLIISGPSDESTDKYYVAEKVARKLQGKRILEKDEIDAKYKGVDLEKDTDYLADEKTQSVTLTDRGLKKCEELLGVGDLYQDVQAEWPHHIRQSLRAKEFFHRDKEYIVKEGQVIIVDEFTGRLMPGRRWSDGLHQAVEAKEGLTIQEETQTLATITLQNYFKMYKKLSGMTGTAYTEAVEFKHIYKLGVVSIPTNRTLQRKNFADQIYKTKKIKFAAVVKEIEQLFASGRPVLVGTTSIENSEELSFLLQKKGIPHNVLNAKHHEQEAHIVAQAGRVGQVTIATNMAGRGTDIILGGNIDFMLKSIVQQGELQPSEKERLIEQYKKQFQQDHEKVVALGGLHVIGTERHEARRIDNQLRGRSGRQGDPGSSRFYISLEDDLMRLFGSERISFIMERFKFPEDEPIEHGMINRTIEIAQKRVESHNFELRKHLLEYDDVMNKQRTVVYAKRRAILEGNITHEEILDLCSEAVSRFTHETFQGGITDIENQAVGILEWYKHTFGKVVSVEALKDKTFDEIEELFDVEMRALYSERQKKFGAESMLRMARMIYLQTIDSRWKEHLRNLDEIREGIHWQAYAQKNPLIEYQHRAYELFVEMMESAKQSIVEILFRIEIRDGNMEVRSVFSPHAHEHREFSSFRDSQPAKTPQKNRSSAPNTKQDKIGRNEPCPCGSGKKYKRCCGQN